MKKGFTLIELLAVLLILAVIALIAVPIVLNIIKDSKNNANLMSAKMYVEAANKSIMNYSLNTRFPDTTCNILDGGNLSCEGIDKEIEIGISNGSQIKSGGIVTIENREVKEIFGLIVDDIVYDYKNGSIGKVKKYKVDFDTTGGSTIASQEVLENRKIVIPSNPTKEGYVFKEWRLDGEVFSFDTPVTKNITLKARYMKDADYTLVKGQSFNGKIKTLASGAGKDFQTSDTLITSIKFFSNADLPEGYTDETLSDLASTDVGSTKDTVKAYWDGNGNIYVYSEGEIFANVADSFMFNYFSAVKSIDLNGLNVSNVKDLSSMFRHCTSLETITLSSNFDSSNVENMSTMFYNCTSLKNVDLVNLDTSNVTNMSDMFYKAGTSTTSLDFSNFDTRKVLNMGGMFARTAMTKLDLSSFNFESVTSTNKMFFESSSLTEILFSPSEAPNLNNASMMFMRCSSLESLKFPIYNTPNLTNISSMFWDCTKMKTLDIRYLDFDTATSYSGMFGLAKNPTLKIKDTQFNRDFMSTNYSNYTPTYIAQ